MDVVLIGAFVVAMAIAVASARRMAQLTLDTLDGRHRSVEETAEAVRQRKRDAHIYEMEIDLGMEPSVPPVASGSWTTWAPFGIESARRDMEYVADRIRKLERNERDQRDFYARVDAARSFPSNPVKGDRYVDHDGECYIWWDDMWIVEVK